jgi:hypothetical protein
MDANRELIAAAYDALIDVSEALDLPSGVERRVAVVPRQSTSLIGAAS